MNAYAAKLDTDVGIAHIYCLLIYLQLNLHASLFF